MACHHPICSFSLHSIQLERSIALRKSTVWNSQSDYCSAGCFSEFKKCKGEITQNDKKKYQLANFPSQMFWEKKRNAQKIFTKEGTSTGTSPRSSPGFGNEAGGAFFRGRPDWREKLRFHNRSKSSMLLTCTWRCFFRFPLRRHVLAQKGQTNGVR